MSININESDATQRVFLFRLTDTTGANIPNTFVPTSIEVVKGTGVGAAGIGTWAASAAASWLTYTATQAEVDTLGAIAVEVTDVLIKNGFTVASDEVVEPAVATSPSGTGGVGASISLTTLISRVRQRGNYENSARFTDAYLTDQINEALGELFELMSDIHEGYWDITTTLTTTANQAYVNLPVDFWRLHALDVLDGSIYRDMQQVSIQERNRFQSSTGMPVAYRIAAGSTRGAAYLYPTPGAAYTLRLIYEPSKAPLVNGTDAIEDYNGWADYVVTGALLRCDEREQRPLGERMAKLETVKKRIIAGASKRRSAEPEYLIPRGGFLFDDWDGAD